ncbi:MAG: cytochrome c [Bdellovibrionales bacterium]|nr:cytochrome c [Bdellovibrionales bacterium]
MKNALAITRRKGVSHSRNITLILRTLSLLILIAIIPHHLSASTETSADEVEEAYVSLKGKDKLIQCVGGEAGKTKNRKGILLFESYESIFKKKSKAYKKTLSAKAKKQRNEARALRIAGDPVCASLQGGSPDEGGTTTPTPTPSSSTGYFYSNGDVTPLGKTEFQIPAGINANAFTGQAVYQMTCTGCHEKRSRPTMPILRVTIAQEPMYYTSDVLSDQDLADLTAYLNIYRTP